MSEQIKAIIDEIEENLQSNSNEFSDQISELIDDEELVTEITNIQAVSLNNNTLSVIKSLEDYVPVTLIEEVEETLFGDIDD